MLRLIVPTDRSQNLDMAQPGQEILLVSQGAKV